MDIDRALELAGQALIRELQGMLRYANPYSTERGAEYTEAIERIQHLRNIYQLMGIEDD
jgi:hypothetical protein